MKNKKVLSGLLLAAMLFCSCGGSKQNKPLEFPQTKWDMNAEDVLQACDMTKDEARAYTENGRGTAFAVDNCELFGENADSVTFAFLNLKKDSSGNFPEYEEGTLGPDEVLCTVQAVYPADVDMNTVFQAMQKEYGKTVQELTIYPLYQSEASGENMTAQEYRESDQVKLWMSDPISELIPENEAEKYRDLWISYRPKLTQENWEEFSQNAAAVTIVLRKDENAVTVYFDAYNLAVYNELKSQLDETIE